MLGLDKNTGRSLVDERGAEGGEFFESCGVGHDLRFAAKPAVVQELNYIATPVNLQGSSYSSMHVSYLPSAQGVAHSARLAVFAVAIAAGSLAASEGVEVAAVRFADPADDLPAAVVEDVTEADMAPIRSVSVAPAGTAEAGDPQPALGNLPQPVSQSHFRELMENSPFTRSLNLSDSLILTGVARFGGKPVATLMDKETKETYVVSDVPNPQGWKMVEISQGADLATVVAKVSVAGGEVVTVRFDENRLKPGEAKPGGGVRGGGDSRGGGSESDEERRKRYMAMREKMSSLSEEQRNKMREMVEKKLKENPNADRGQLWREAIEKVSSGNGRQR